MTKNSTFPLDLKYIHLYKIYSSSANDYSLYISLRQGSLVLGLEKWLFLAVLKG